MSKIVILGDLHLGVRNDSLVFAEYQLSTLDSILDYMVKNKLKSIIQLGDIFDRRKYTNHVVLDLWKRRFFDRMVALGITMHLIIGNHDSAFKNTLRVNTPDLFLAEYKNIHIYSTPQDAEIDGVNFMMMPWICQDNEEETKQKIIDSKAFYACGHLELANFPMNRGHMHTEGMSSDGFKKFDKVFTGHYHTKSSEGNIHYLGIPYEFTWIDYDDPKGFHVFNKTNGALKFIKNTNTMFHRWEYNDSEKDSDYWETFDVASLQNKYLKLFVVEKNDTYQFDRLVDALYNGKLEDFKIIEEYDDLSADAVDDEDVSLEDSIGLVDSYVDSSDYSGDKPRLKTMMKGLYVSALDVLE